MGWWDSLNNINPLFDSNKERAEKAARANEPKRTAVPTPRTSGMPTPRPGAAPVAPGAKLDYSSTNVATVGGSVNDATVLGLKPDEAGLTFYQRVPLGGPATHFFGQGAVARAPRSVLEYMKSVHGMSKPDMEALQRKLYRNGYYGNVSTGSIVWGKADDYTMSALKGALLTASRYAIDGKTTLDDVLSPEFAPANAGGAGANAPFSGTRTTKQVDLSTAGQAKGTLQSAMTTLLGRRPTDAEVSKFHDALNAAERDHPTVTKTTFEDGIQTTQSQSGGFGADDQAAAAQDDVFDQHGKEYAGVATNALTDAFERLVFGG